MSGTKRLEWIKRYEELKKELDELEDKIYARKDFGNQIDVTIRQDEIIIGRHLSVYKSVVIPFSEIGKIFNWLKEMGILESDEDE